VNSPERHHGAAPAALVLLLAMVAFSATVWAGAQVAARLFGAGRWLEVGLGRSARAALALPQHAGSPEMAWPARLRGDLPGPLPYWVCTAVVAVAVVAAFAPVLRVVWRPGVGSPRRVRLGVDVKARLAVARDLAPLLVRRPEPGRLVLGRVGRYLVATEDRSRPARRSLAPRRRGDRSSVLVIGPTRCGKTSNCVSGILDWSGPAILSSVKSDLMGASLGWRSRLGEVRVFDPTGATDQSSAGWSPLRAAHTLSSAQKAARALCDAGPQRGAENLDFWLKLGEQLLWPLLWVAAVSGRTMRDLVRWVLIQDRPHPEAGPGEVVVLLEEQLYSGDPDRQIEAAAALDALQATWAMDDRTRASTYATAQTLVAPWTDPAVAASAARCEIDLDWLVAGANTLYICGPAHEQARLAPVFGGLMGDLVQQAFEHASRQRAALPSTLLVMDEAGNTPTRWLPGVASTCAGIGLLLVTIWQSKAQIEAAYGRVADSVITNHGTKVIFSGVSDPTTMRYAASLLGDEEVPRRSESVDVGGWRRSISESMHPTQLVPTHALRQIPPGDALLLHGTLPPAHLHARPYYAERRLRERAEMPADTIRARA
jgi:type IV secretion system protein VirD4